MAILPILIQGEPVLHRPAIPVEAIDDDVVRLAHDMFETMDAAPGVGLAAPQVGVGRRMFVYGWTDDEGVEHRGTAINPTLWIAPAVPESIDPLHDDEQEGCLSFPGERFALRRAPRARLRFQNLEGSWIEIEAEGWLARIFQHEYDHLNGVL